MSEQADRRGETEHERLDRNLAELLQELRVAIPGIQFLFAFLLVVPFSQGWQNVTNLQRDVFFAAFLATTISSILFIAPSTYHRLRWRERDKEHMLQMANRLAIGGAVFLALGMTATVFLITDVLFKASAAAGVTAAAAGAFAWFWFGLPLLRRATR